MKFLIFLSSLLLCSSNVVAFVPAPPTRGKVSVVGASVEADTVFDQEQYIAESKEMRLKHLEEQSMFALKIACENYGTWDEYIAAGITPCGFSCGLDPDCWWCGCRIHGRVVGP